MRNLQIGILLFVFLGVVAPASADRYATDITGTVGDSYTALMWQRHPDNQARVWAGALAYCEGLTLAGVTDWRLPNIKELRSIVDDAGFDAVAFPGTLQAGYWSSTSRAGSPNFALYVGFPSGAVYSDIKTNSNTIVRCVR